MATEQSPEARELSLVGKVEMRIALADGDQKLQATLNTYLAPLLLKLASEHMSVRNKVCICTIIQNTRSYNSGSFSDTSFQVISICQHINLRIKPE